MSTHTWPGLALGWPACTVTPMNTNPLHITALATAPQGQIGSITCWDCTTTELEPLADAWKDAKLAGPGGALSRPLAPNPAKALHAACLWAANGSNTVVRRHPSKGGMLLIHEAQGVDEEDPTYTPDLWVKIEKGALTWNRPSHPLCGAIRTKFYELRNSLTAQSAGDWLGRLVRELDGVPLRRAGGMYFLPAGPAGVWATVTELITSVCPGMTIFQIPAFAQSGDTLPAVLAAVREELAGQLTRLTKAVEDGGLGTKAQETKTREVEQLRESITRYEQLLGTSLADLATRAKLCQESLGKVALAPTGMLDAL